MIDCSVVKTASLPTKHGAAAEWLARQRRSSFVAASTLLEHENDSPPKKKKTFLRGAETPEVSLVLRRNYNQQGVRGAVFSLLLLLLLAASACCFCLQHCVSLHTSVRFPAWCGARSLDHPWSVVPASLKERYHEQRGP